VGRFPVSAGRRWIKGSKFEKIQGKKHIEKCSEKQLTAGWGGRLVFPADRKKHNWEEELQGPKKKRGVGG